jgi:hypothetical protein
MNVFPRECNLDATGIDEFIAPEILGSSVATVGQTVGIPVCGYPFQTEDCQQN